MAVLACAHAAVASMQAWQTDPLLSSVRDAEDAIRKLDGYQGWVCPRHPSCMSPAAAVHVLTWADAAEGRELQATRCRRTWWWGWRRRWPSRRRRCALLILTFAAHLARCMPAVQWHLAAAHVSDDSLHKSIAVESS